MTAKMGIRDTALSVFVFGAVLFALVSFDPRVKDEVSTTLRTTSAFSLGHRAGEVGGTLWRAARDKSMDGAPVVVFASVGALLTLFMLRT
jgi:membrane protein implicated in regulation of membrane protease activity